jgi:tetratricopeptide (TPR) repeat protein
MCWPTCTWETWRRRTARYEEAAGYYRKSIQRITADYTRPRDCEALYRLGLVLKQQKKWDDAVDTLYRATWDQAYYAAAILNWPASPCCRESRKKPWIT